MVTKFTKEFLDEKFKFLIGYLIYPYNRCKSLRLPWSDIRKNKLYVGSLYDSSYTDILRYSYDDENQSLLDFIKNVNKRYDTHILRRKMRKEKGFDDTESWELSYVIAYFIYPRLKMYRDMYVKGENTGLWAIQDSANEQKDYTQEEIIEILDKMLLGFNTSFDVDDISRYDKLYTEYYGDNYPTFEFSNETDQGFTSKINRPVCKNLKEYKDKLKLYAEQEREGMLLFAKHFRNLWD